MRTNSKPNRWRGLLAGAIGGLIASFVMSQVHSTLQKVESSGKQGAEDSTVRTASAISQGQTSPGRAPSPTRSRAITAALQREDKAAASHTALSRQARASARIRGAASLHQAAEKAVRTKGKAGLKRAAQKAARTRARG